MLRMLVIFLVLNFSASCENLSSQPEEKDPILGSLVSAKPSFSKEQVLGIILRQTLENMHLSKKRINDSFSEKSLKLYIERLDYGKQFLLEEDVDQFLSYKKKMDDEFNQGKLTILEKTKDILTKRITTIKDYVLDVLKKPFDLDKEETLETDPKKREFVKTEAQLKDRWRKMIKLDILNQIVELQDEQNNDEDSKDKKSKKTKKKKKQKQLSTKELEKKAREKVAKRYVKVFDRLLAEKRNSRLDKFYNSITKVFDPHTHYMIPDDKEDFDIEMTGKLEGIGASLREEGSYIKVEKIIPGSASWKGKELQEGDIILAVAQANEEKVSIVDMSIRDAVKLIRGPKGTLVKLTVKKPDGQVTVISIVRDEVVIEESYVKHAIVEDTKDKVKIGYITVPKFYRDFSDSKGRNSSDDVKKSIIALKKEKVQGIILDLRNNAGGALEDARLMSGLFVKKGPIVQVQSPYRGIEVLRDTDGKVFFKKPLIVLVNRFSASASEIVAAAMQDYKRAVIVGTSEQTHGKGTVQAVLNLDDRISTPARFYAPYGALKLTIQMFYRITGASTQFKGVSPDILLPGPLEYIDSGERSLEYPIPYSEVKPVPFAKWTDYKYDLKTLKKNSEKRVAKSKKFQQIKESVDWYTKKKNESERSLTLKDIIALRKESKSKSDQFEDDIQFENLKVHHISSKTRDDVEKEKQADFSKELRTDPVVYEALQIFTDMKLKK